MGNSAEVNARIHTGHGTGNWHESKKSQVPKSRLVGK
jgi:hypothetical protein